jgi:hypothetical protein
MLDSTMSKTSRNEKVSSRNLEINRRQELLPHLLPRNSIFLAGKGVRAVKVLNLEQLTDRKPPGQRKSSSSAAYIIMFRTAIAATETHVYTSLESGVLGSG